MPVFRVRVIFFLLLLIWCSGFSIPLFFKEAQYAVSSVVLNFFYSHVCHQQSHKSFYTDGCSFLVCARCMGIYYGALLISIIFLFIKKIRTGFFLPALLIMFSDVILANTGIYNYSKSFALITGLIFGMTLYPYILYTLENSIMHNEVK